MATKKISELDAISSIESNDLFVVVDTSEGETNKITKENALSGLQPTISSENKISSDLVDDDQATNKFVTSSDITNWNSKISTETDPVFTASPAYGITATDISNWNSATDNIFYLVISPYGQNYSRDDVIKDIDTKYKAEGEAFLLKSVFVVCGHNYTGVSGIDGENNVLGKVTYESNKFRLSFTMLANNSAEDTHYGNTYKIMEYHEYNFWVDSSNIVHWEEDTSKTRSYLVNKYTGSLNSLPLAMNNTDSFTPSGNYNPATKKYVDDSIGGISIPTKTSDLTNDSGFITTESDPVFTASDAYGISSSDINSWNGKQDALTAGTNISISNGTISATDTTYSAGTGINIDANNVISATGGGGSSYTAGDGINIDANNVISANVNLIQSTASTNDVGTSSDNRLDLSQLKPGKYIYRNYSAGSGAFYFQYIYNETTKTGSITNIVNTRNKGALSWNTIVIEVYKDLSDVYSYSQGTYIATIELCTTGNDVSFNTQLYNVVRYSLKRSSNSNFFITKDATYGCDLDIYEFDISTTETTKLKNFYDIMVNQAGTIKPSLIIGKYNKQTALGTWYSSGSYYYLTFPLTGNLDYNTSTSTSYGVKYFTYYIVTYLFKLNAQGNVTVTRYTSTNNVLSDISSYGPLGRTNTTSYTPTADYHPATKKYVDDGLSTKQGTLTAGTGISIDTTTNTISTTGGGGGSDFITISSDVTPASADFVTGNHWYKMTNGAKLRIKDQDNANQDFYDNAIIYCYNQLTDEQYMCFVIIDDYGYHMYEYIGSSVTANTKFTDKSPLTEDSLGKYIRVVDSLTSPTSWGMLFDSPITIVKNDINIQYNDYISGDTLDFMFPANTIIVGTLNELMLHQYPIMIYMNYGERYQITGGTVSSIHFEPLLDKELTMLGINSEMEHKINYNLPFTNPYACEKELVACLPLYYQGQNNIDTVSLQDIQNHFIAPFTNIPRDYNDSSIVDNTVDPNVFADPNYINITPTDEGIAFNNLEPENFFIEINYADVLGNNSVFNTGMMRGDIDINASLTFMSQMTLGFDTTLKSRMFEGISGTRETYEGIANHWEVNNYITPAEVYIGTDEMTFGLALSSNYNDSSTLNSYIQNAYLKVVNSGNSLEPGEFERRCYIKIWRMK